MRAEGIPGDVIAAATPHDVIVASAAAGSCADAVEGAQYLDHVTRRCAAERDLRYARPTVETLAGRQHRRRCRTDSRLTSMAVVGGPAMA